MMTQILLALLPHVIAFIAGWLLPSPLTKVMNAEKKASAGNPSDLDRLP